MKTGSANPQLCVGSPRSQTLPRRTNHPLPRSLPSAPNPRCMNSYLVSRNQATRSPADDASREL
jgi:hypothetical protein